MSVVEMESEKMREGSLRNKVREGREESHTHTYRKRERIEKENKYY